MTVRLNRDCMPASLLGCNVRGTSSVGRLPACVETRDGNYQNFPLKLIGPCTANLLYETFTGPYHVCVC